MVPILALIAGAVSGAYIAKRRRGKFLDMAQYGASFGIALALLAMIIAVALEVLGSRF